MNKTLKNGECKPKEKIEKTIDDYMKNGTSFKLTVNKSNKDCFYNKLVDILKEILNKEYNIDIYTDPLLKKFIIIIFGEFDSPEEINEKSTILKIFKNDKKIIINDVLTFINNIKPATSVKPSTSVKAATNVSSKNSLQITHEKIKYTPYNSYSVLGEGTYGTIISPSLPNNEYESNPLNVTKVMKSKNDKNTIKIINYIKNIPMLDFNIIQYKKTYTRKNFDKINNLKPRFGSEGYNKSNAFKMIRMPKLGYSFSDIYNSKEIPTLLYNKINIKILFMEILKLLFTVLQIFKKGYVHADIREPNVVCSDKCILTIIDFDLFMPFEEFIDKYDDGPERGYFMYSFPPEMLWFLNPNPTSDIIKYRNGGFDYLNKLYNNDKNLQKLTTNMNNISVGNSKDKFKASKTKAIQHQRAKNNRLFKHSEFFDIIRPFFDLWGLMLSIHVLMLTIDTSILDVRLSIIYTYIYETLIPNSLHIDYTQRYTIEDAFNNYKTFLTKIHDPYIDAYIQELTPTKSYTDLKVFTEKMSKRLHCYNLQNECRQNMERVPVKNKSVKNMFRNLTLKKNSTLKNLGNMITPKMKKAMANRRKSQNGKYVSRTFQKHP